MGVGGTNKAKFKGVNANFLLNGQTFFQSRAHIVSSGNLGIIFGGLNIVTIGFKVSELIIWRKLSMGFTITFDLSHLSNGLPLHTCARIVSGNRLAFNGGLGKHIAFGNI